MREASVRAEPDWQALSAATPSSALIQARAQQRQAHTELGKLRRGGHGVCRRDDQRRPRIPTLLARPHHAAQAAARSRRGRARRRAAGRGRGHERGGALAQRARERLCQARRAVRVIECLPCCGSGRMSLKETCLLNDNIYAQSKKACKRQEIDLHAYSLHDGAALFSRA